MKIALLSCVSLKRPVTAPARLLYVSPLFRLNLRYATQLGVDRIFVLSAKYGLVDIDTRIEPYDQTLNAMSASERRRWADGVLAQMRHAVDLQRDVFTVLAGRNYREHIIPHLAHVDVPMEGLGIGRQLQFLSNATRLRPAPFDPRDDECEATTDAPAA